MEELVKASLDWLDKVAFPQSKFLHPNDENTIKCASRALNKHGVPVNIDEVRTYCLELNWPSEAIDKLADWYGRPTRLRLKPGVSWNVKDLRKIWEDLC